MPRRRHSAPGDAGAIRAGRVSSLPPVSDIRSLDPPRMDGTNILLSDICVLPNGDRHGCRHPGLAENAALRAGRRVRMSAAATRQTPGVFAPIRSPCFIARPSPTTSGIRFASDSLLEEDGFEPSVPLVSRGAIRREFPPAASSRPLEASTPPSSRPRPWRYSARA